MTMMLSAGAQEKGMFNLHVNLPSKLFKGEKNVTLSLDMMNEKGEVTIGTMQLKADTDDMLKGDFSMETDGQYCASGQWVEDPHYGFSFFIEPGTVNVIEGKGGMLNRMHVNGTPLNDAYQQYKDEADRLEPRNSQAADSLIEVYMKRYADTPLFGFFFTSHSAVSYAIFKDMKAEVERLWAIGGEKPKKVKYFLNTYNRICHNDLGNGQPFRDVEIPDATVEDSRTVHLSDYIGKGKWVFIDFWASWCGGCRQAIPRVKAAYEEVKDKNVMFISIAEWDKRKAALKAMDEEQMPWLQLIDEKGACGEAYMFNAIPRLMLFAPDGTIADKDVDSRRLHEILAKHLGD